jgi:hypothetical protein
VRKISKMSVTSGKKLLEGERARIKALVKSDPSWWNDPGRSRWAREQFGPTLTEKVGDVHPNGEPFIDHQCNVCGKVPPLNEKIIQLAFSFCEEYDCHMNICFNCIVKMELKLP